jgi:hypothetical protein
MAPSELVMGTKGFLRAADIDYRSDEVILEVGSGDSTHSLAQVGPMVFTIDAWSEAFYQAGQIRNVIAVHGWAETALTDWNRPIGFAWLDGYDWPYTGNPREYYADQRDWYHRLGRTFSQEASRESHLRIVELISDHTRVIAFDDTWRTHWFQGGGDLDCTLRVPPATKPAPALAMDQPYDRVICGLEKGHPHHDRPEVGWNGKGGDAIPYLIDHGFRVLEYELGLVILERP